METKVISARVDKKFFDRVNAVADRLYPKSYTGQPNRTQLIMDALKLFCDLGEAGSLDGINLSQIDTEHLVYLVNNPREDILKELQKGLYRIENKLDTSFADTVNKIEQTLVYSADKNKKAFVDSVDEQILQNVDEITTQIFLDKELANVVGASTSTIKRIRTGKRQKSQFLPYLLPYKVKFDYWEKRIESQKIVELWTVYKNGNEEKSRNSPMEKWQAEIVIEKQKETNSQNPDAGLYDTGKQEIRPYIWKDEDSEKVLKLILG